MVWSDQMWVSINEVQSTCLKAARNAGYPWGLAEEAAAAARWLAMRGLPFLEPLGSGVLTQMHRLESLSSARRIGSSFGPSNPSRRLGPISVLTALADEHLAPNLAVAEVSFRSLAAPIFIVPILAKLSRRHEQPLLVRWPGVALECRSGEIAMDGRCQSGLDCAFADWVSVAKSPNLAVEARPNGILLRQGAELDSDRWRDLKALSDRDYVPEGETVRLQSSEAGLIDND